MIGTFLSVSGASVREEKSPDLATKPRDPGRLFREDGGAWR